MDVTEENMLYNRFIRVSFTTKKMKAKEQQEKAVLEKIDKINKNRKLYSAAFSAGIMPISKYGEETVTVDKYTYALATLGLDSYMTVDSRDYSIKPSITFSCKRVPGNFAYDMTLSIKNLVLRKGLTPQDISFIKIEVGYGTNDENKKSDVYWLQVFYAYQATPLPNSLTVFSGLSFSPEAAQILKASDIRTHYIISTLLSDDIKKAILKAAGGEDNTDVLVYTLHGASACSYIIETLAGLLFSAGNNSLVQTSGFSGIGVSWNIIQKMLDTKGEKLEGETKYDLLRKFMEWVQDFVALCNKDVTVKVNIQGDVITIISDYGLESDKFIPRLIPHLTHCRTASLLASILTVKALYDPNIKPGTFFYMPLNFYSADKSITSLEKPEGLFKVLTQEVDFSTTEKNNEMKLLAVQVTKQTALEILTREIPSLAVKDNTLLLAVKAESNDTNSEKAKKRAAYWQQSLNMGVGRLVVTARNDTLKKIAKQEWGTTVIWTAKEIDTAIWTRFLHGGPSLPKLRDIYVYDFFFLIPLFTYLPSSLKGGEKAYAQGSGDINVFNMLRDFSTLYANYCLEVPSAPSKATIQANKQSIMALIEVMPFMYANMKDATEYSDTWQVIYFCLKNNI